MSGGSTGILQVLFLIEDVIAMSDLDIQARRDAAKADARAQAGGGIHRRPGAPGWSLLWASSTQTVLALIAVLKQKGALDAADLAPEVEQLRQIHAVLSNQVKGPFDFT